MHLLTNVDHDDGTGQYCVSRMIVHILISNVFSDWMDSVSGIDAADGDDESSLLRFIAAIAEAMARPVHASTRGHSHKNSMASTLCYARALSDLNCTTNGSTCLLMAMGHEHALALLRWILTILSCKQMAKPLQDESPLAIYEKVCESEQAMQERTTWGNYNGLDPAEFSLHFDPHMWYITYNEQQTQDWGTQYRHLNLLQPHRIDSWEAAMSYTLLYSLDIVRCSVLGEDAFAVPIESDMLSMIIDVAMHSILIAVQSAAAEFVKLDEVGTLTEEQKARDRKLRRRRSSSESGTRSQLFGNEESVLCCALGVLLAASKSKEGRSIFYGLNELRRNALARCFVACLELPRSDIRELVWVIVYTLMRKGVEKSRQSMSELIKNMGLFDFEAQIDMETTAEKIISTNCICLAIVNEGIKCNAARMSLWVQESLDWCIRDDPSMEKMQRLCALSHLSFAICSLYSQVPVGMLPDGEGDCTKKLYISFMRGCRVLVGDLILLGFDTSVLSDVCSTLTYVLRVVQSAIKSPQTSILFFDLGVLPFACQVMSYLVPWFEKSSHAVHAEPVGVEAAMILLHYLQPSIFSQDNRIYSQITSPKLIQTLLSCAIGVSAGGGRDVSREQVQTPLSRPNSPNPFLGSPKHSPMFASMKGLSSTNMRSSYRGGSKRLKELVTIAILNLPIDNELMEACFFALTFNFLANQDPAIRSLGCKIIGQVKLSTDGARDFCNLDGVSALLGILVHSSSSDERESALYGLMHVTLDFDAQVFLGECALPLLLEMHEEVHTDFEKRLLSQVLKNIIQNPENRTCVYRAELGRSNLVQRLSQPLQNLWKGARRGPIERSPWDPSIDAFQSLKRRQNKEATKKKKPSRMSILHARSKKELVVPGAVASMGTTFPKFKIRLSGSC